MGLVLSQTRRAAGIGLVVLLVAVFPANVEMLARYREEGASWFAELLLWRRLPLQLALMWWVWRVSRSRSRSSIRSQCSLTTPYRQPHAAATR